MATTSRAIVLEKRKVQIGSVVEIDACLEETHTLSNAITDHPLEEGFNATDHSRPEPDRVTLRCFVSNTPLSDGQVKDSVRQGVVSFETTAPTVIVGRGDEAFKALKKMRDEGTLISVVTTLKTYGVSKTEGMMIESINIPRTSKNYDGIEFTVSLKQVRIVKNASTTQVVPREKQTQKKKKKGEQTTKPPETEESSLYKTGQFRPPG